MRAADFEQLASQAAVLERQGEWGAAGDLHIEAYHLALAEGELEKAAGALISQARVLNQQGRFSDAEERVNTCREHAERHGLAGAAAGAISMLAAIRYLRQDFTAAATLYEEVQELARNVGDDGLVASTTQNLGIIANIHGDFREARALYLEGIGAMLRAENNTGAVMIYLNLGKVCVCLEEWLEAEIYFERGIEIAEQLGEVPMRARLHANLSVPLIHTGETPRARTALDTAEKLATRIGGTDTLSHIHRLRGMIARIAGDFATAHEHLAESLRLAAGPRFELARAEALEEKGRLGQAEGHLGQARRSLEEARTCFVALGARHDIARTEQLIEKCGGPSPTGQAMGTGA